MCLWSKPSVFCTVFGDPLSLTIPDLEHSRKLAFFRSQPLNGSASLFDPQPALVPEPVHPQYDRHQKINPGHFRRNVLLNLRARQLREPLRLNAREQLMTRGELSGWSIPVGVGIVSLILALTLPAGQIQWSGWVYFLMAIILRVHWFWHKRRLRVEKGS